MEEGIVLISDLEFNVQVFTGIAQIAIMVKEKLWCGAE
jgi:hypothetical protein